MVELYKNRLGGLNYRILKLEKDIAMLMDLEHPVRNSHSSDKVIREKKDLT